jgi:hypothetical protein
MLPHRRVQVVQAPGYRVALYDRERIHPRALGLWLRSLLRLSEVFSGF